MEQQTKERKFSSILFVKYSCFEHINFIAFSLLPFALDSGFTCNTHLTLGEERKNNKIFLMALEMYYMEITLIVAVEINMKFYLGLISLCLLHEAQRSNEHVIIAPLITCLDEEASLSIFYLRRTLSFMNLE